MIAFTDYRARHFNYSWAPANNLKNQNLCSKHTGENPPWMYARHKFLHSSNWFAVLPTFKHRWKPFACKHTQTTQATLQCQTYVGCETAANQMSKASIGKRRSSETLLSLSVCPQVVDQQHLKYQWYLHQIKFPFWSRSHHSPLCSLLNKNLPAWPFNLPGTQLTHTSINSMTLL